MTMVSDLVSPRRFADVRLATGVRLRYAEHGSASGEPVVLLHGYTDSWFSYSRILPLLPVDRLRLIVPDQRGHGASDRPERGYTTDDFAADAVALLDALGIERAAIVGHSMGSLVAQRVAVRAPERVSRIVLIGSFASIVNDETRAFRAELDNLTDPVPVELARDFQMSTLHQPVPEAFLERVIGESLSLPAATWRAVLDGLFAGDDPSLLTRITAPTLILWGELDGFCSRAAQDQLLAAIPSASLIAYPETGHDPHWERPETVARDIAAFLAATPARAS